LSSVHLYRNMLSLRPLLLPEPLVGASHIELVGQCALGERRSAPRFS
jgi:hypothetical protein